MSEIPFAESMQTGNQTNIPPFFIAEDNPQDSTENSSTTETQSQPKNSAQTSQNFSISPPDVNNLDLPQRKNDKKYHIIDLFWVINPNINQGKLSENEAHLAIISYNINFNNLRIVFYNLTQNSFQGNVLFLNNCEKLIDGTIYPTSAYIILNIQSLNNFPCIEQIITQTGESWQQQRPQVFVSKNSQNFTIELKIKNFIYTFKNYQFNLFLDVCKFCLSKGRVLHGYYNLIK
jgi:hypothetical protein